MTPKKLLEALAPHEPYNGDELGGCVHCGGTPPGQTYGYAGRFLCDHKPGCAWVKARRLLGDKLPADRVFDHTETKKWFEKGYKVQYLRDPGLRDQWCDCDNPSWDSLTQFRLSPNQPCPKSVFRLLTSSTPS